MFFGFRAIKTQSSFLQPLGQPKKPAGARARLHVIPPKRGERTRRAWPCRAVGRGLYLRLSGFKKLLYIQHHNKEQGLY